MLNLMNLRVGLFMPATQTRFIQKAHKYEADAVVLDLEDSVPADQKEEARNKLVEGRSLLSAQGLPTLVRVNAEQSLFAFDARAALMAGIDCLIIPKQSSAHQVRELVTVLAEVESEIGRPLGSTRIVALIESPAAVVEVDEIARSSPRMAGLLFGSEDYCAALAIPSADAILDWPAQKVALAARAANLAAFGIPGSIQSIYDTQTFTGLFKRARAMGFTGCFCVHPSQVAAAFEALRPPLLEVEHAKRVIQAAEAHANQGAFAVDGRMIDAPVVEQAKLVLARWSGAGGVSKG